MELGKGTKIGIFLIVMFITAIPTFFALSSTQLVIYLLISQEQFMVDSSGYYLLPIAFVCAIAFFASLILLIKTIRAKGQNITFQE